VPAPLSWPGTRHKINVTEIMQSEITPEYLVSQGLSQNFLKRFWSKVDKNGAPPIHNVTLGPCWKWMRPLSENGYGGISMGRTVSLVAAGRILAHRASWIIHFGPIPEGKGVLHKCDNPQCTNPNHLYVGTQKDNCRDMIERGHMYDRRGEKCGMAKVSNEDVSFIRASLGLSHRKLGRMFGIDCSTVTRIINRKTWAHVP